MSAVRTSRWVAERRARPLRQALAVLALLGAGATAALAEPLDFERFFSGRLTGTGAIDNYREGTHRPFTATIEGAWSGPQGRVTEVLTYADGEVRRFAWTFDRDGPARWTGHRDDLVGDAAVTMEGDTLRMTYTARTRVPSGKVWTLSFDDRFDQSDAHTVILKGGVSYLFIGVGATAMRITKGG